VSRTITIAIRVATGGTTPVIGFAFRDWLITAGRGAVVSAAGQGINGTAVSVVASGGAATDGIAGFARLQLRVIAVSRTVAVFARIAARRTAMIARFTFGNRLMNTRRGAARRISGYRINRARIAVAAIGWTSA